ncbi:MAG: ABC transporter substrate-binding protein [Oscillatoriaceae bacterium SKW80]|nr:ABC transporter substrate-binding protein [Oscillatoriaceae bacterium SKYG93]MCX8121209.1 ABC transporter substrate-binding protein [Oscillatoriaceae bacterium SKW80]MDW8453461.1 ABC transporter substrate-binding protein [Oscillatoriaceae cyanobacterium SKYGB_i_bin93]HIK26813.1 ABC transporter substrate-binding protein [Oscillatoriaceae cyanobacterium M7585_C2015_266]
MITNIWSRWQVVLLVLILNIALIGCSLEQFRTNAAPVSQLVYSVLSDPKTFNPVLSTESPNIFGLTYEGLVTENGLSGEIEPALAESWEISEDKKKIVFTLREGLKWSDGHPLTADDVVFTYNDIYLNEKIPSSARDILRIGKNRALPTVRKLDARRIEFSVPEPFAPFLRSTGLSILPAHALLESVTSFDSEGKPRFLSTWKIDTDPKELVCNGPYKLESYRTSEQVVFRRNPYYWRKDSEGNPQPYIEKIVWQIVENQDTSLLKFIAGTSDVMGVSPENFSFLKQKERRYKFKIYNGGPAPGTTFLAFNLNKGRNASDRPFVEPIKSKWFNKVEFRRAIASAIARQTMINNIYRGLGEPQNSPISVQSPYYFSPEEGLKVYEFNLEKAKKLLLEAGFKYNDRNELLDSEGNRVRFTLLTNAENRTRVAMGAQIKQDLSKIGIQVDFNPIAFSTLVEKLTNTRDWEATIIGFTGGVEPNEGANFWAPEGRAHIFNLGPQPGQPPITGWEVADWERKIGDLYIKGAQELDENKRKEIYAESQSITQEYLPVIYLVNPLALSAIRERIQGIKYSALGGALWNIYELRVTE